MNFDVDVELHPNLHLTGCLECKVTSYPDEGVVVSDHALRVHDKDLNLVPVDWDDLKEKTQDMIEHQVTTQYRNDTGRLGRLFLSMVDPWRDAG